jgi:hypothetical protein
MLGETERGIPVLIEDPEHKWLVIKPNEQFRVCTRFWKPLLAVFKYYA